MSMYYACDYNLHAFTNPDRETSNDLVLWWLLNCTQPWQGEEYFTELARDVLEQGILQQQQQQPPLPSYPSTVSPKSWRVEDKSDGDTLHTESPFTAEGSSHAHEAALDHHEHCQRFLRFQNAGVSDGQEQPGKVSSSAEDDHLLALNRAGTPGVDRLEYYNQALHPTDHHNSHSAAPHVKYLGKLGPSHTSFSHQYGSAATHLRHEYNNVTKVNYLGQEGQYTIRASLGETAEDWDQTRTADYDKRKRADASADFLYPGSTLAERPRHPQERPRYPQHRQQYRPIAASAGGGKPNPALSHHQRPSHVAAYTDRHSHSFGGTAAADPLASPFLHPGAFAGIPGLASSDPHLGNGRCRVIRGVSLWGGVTDPPASSSEHHVLVPVVLQILAGGVAECCYPKWLASEELDGRRIIRLRRQQQGPHISVGFSIVGSALEHPVPATAAHGDGDVLEVSCIRCVETDQDGFQYYITSVEVVGIVELLVGTEVSDAAERRRERGRVRSNLVTYWSKKPILTRKHVASDEGASTEDAMRMELARRIMGYETRRPRGFDKEVRILAWANLVPAMVRALNSYYAEVRR